MKSLKHLVIFLFPLLVTAQEPAKGIQFVHGKSWNNILAEAKAENKYVFVDCYTTWCGPCKYMAAKVFPNDTVGQLMNSKFISAGVQIDSTQKDNEEIKNWYADASFINKKYKIRAYPTYLVFGPDGELVDKFIGSMGVQAFISRAGQSLEPSTQYFTMAKQFEAHKKDSAFLKKLMIAAANNYEDYDAYFKAYVATQPTMFTQENIQYLGRFGSKTSDTAFKLILANQEAYDKTMGKGKANDALVAIIVKTETRKLFAGKDANEADGKEVERIYKEYPKQAKEVVATAKAHYFDKTKNWKSFGPAVQEYMKLYGNKLANDPGQLNAFAWDVFENIGNKTLLTEALGWSKQSMSGMAANDPALMDTYANLQYRLGNVKEAAEWEGKALELAKDSGDTSSYEETLAKMKKGEKTWKE